MQEVQELKKELRNLLIETLKLEEMTPESLGDDDPLFTEGLGLDSIDALELTVALEKKYRLSIPSAEVGKQAFASISALAAFVAQNRKDRG
jgi:acyl carrier protein